jgi:hypothetical protein
MINYDIKPSFDVTDGPSGVKYIILHNFLTEYFKTGKSSDFDYMNFTSDRESIQSIIKLIEQYSKENSYQYFTFCNTVCAVGPDMFINSGYGDEDNTTVFQVEVTGDSAAFDKFFDYLRHKEYKIKRSESSIHWFYFNPQNGISSKAIRFDKNPNRAKDIHYPFINKGVNKYMKEYLKSDASILIMIGDPGTGKTSLVRDFAFRNKLKTFMTFDESIIKSDDFFVNFMTDKTAQLLVVEDADVLIGSRDKERNDLMAKFLNISDGLISHQNKKIIFTTNLSNVDKIDSALIRPGRCHGVLNFRKLTLDEANVIREDIKKPEFVAEREYTLADTFNEIHSNVEQTKKFKVGII